MSAALRALRTSHAFPAPRVAPATRCRLGQQRSSVLAPRAGSDRISGRVVVGPEAIIWRMPKLSCRCGYVHNLSPIPDDGFQVFPDWATDKLLYADETRTDEWEIRDLHQTALSRLYSCPHCEAIMWDKAGDGKLPHLCAVRAADQDLRRPGRP
jgi:hypothetical protein